ncbi:unnamed protein product [Cylicostephanus goldi]|uniref:Uncharacterized protein n=1 Tax=Cylicostephanus goldi TaxID=71465 RepID=A0A3P7Q6M4_CYLGO|nr:unnamed protein product [Cylicostephanus goldi]
MLTTAGRRLSRVAVSPRPRMRNYTLGNMPPPPAVNIRTHDMISPQERRFLEAAERGDKPTIQECLLTVRIRYPFKREGETPLNVNCLDSMGRSALEIAVDNENIEVWCKNKKILSSILCWEHPESARTSVNYAVS